MGAAAAAEGQPEAPNDGGKICWRKPKRQRDTRLSAAAGARARAGALDDCPVQGGEVSDPRGTIGFEKPGGQRRRR